MLDQFLRDPYPTYAHLRSTRPVLADPDLGGWAVFRYQDVAAALRDPRLSNAVTPHFMSRVPAESRPECRDLEAILENAILYMDAPNHTALKSAVSPFLSPAAVRGQEQRTRELVRSLLPQREGLFELVAGLADPLPPRVIGHLLGAQEVHNVSSWSHELAHFVGSGALTTEEIARAASSATALRAHFAQSLAARREQPGQDMLSALQARGLPDEDVLALACALFGAGNDTSTSLISSAVYLLLRHKQLSADPEAALEEVLRYDGPAQITLRVATEETSVGGQTIQAGELVQLFLGSANRDPERFAEPERFWVERPDNRHLAFGWGIHFCVGAFLARMQARIVLEELRERFPRSRLAGEPQRILRMTLRQLKTLPVLLRG